MLEVTGNLPRTSFVMNSCFPDGLCAQSRRPLTLYESTTDESYGQVRDHSDGALVSNINGLNSWLWGRQCITCTYREHLAEPRRDATEAAGYGQICVLKLRAHSCVRDLASTLLYHGMGRQMTRHSTRARCARAISSDVNNFLNILNVHLA